MNITPRRSRITTGSLALALSINCYAANPTPAEYAKKISYKEAVYCTMSSARMMAIFERMNDDNPSQDSQNRVNMALIIMKQYTGISNYYRDKKGVPQDVITEAAYSSLEQLKTLDTDKQVAIFLACALNLGKK